MLDDTPRIAVLGAMASELAALRKELTDAAEHVVAGAAFTTGMLAGKAVVLVGCGVSMVNAAMTAQRTLDLFNVSHLMVSGCAGGVDPELKVGDVFVAGQWGQYLEVVMGREGPSGFEPASGAPSGYGNFGMMFPKPVMVTGPDGETERRFWFPVAPTMLSAARKLAVTVVLSKGSGAAQLDKTPRVVAGGNGVSGAALVNNTELRDYVFETFQAGVLDCESAAVAHVAWCNGKPFLAVRGLSSLAGAGDGDKLYTAFNQLASDNAALVTMGILRSL
ncbi:MAG: 5'-methylthioadenosine/S-adenosylhomocysteine nucleosidase [Phenylobacterium sp.]|uniref:5'-methylthioadenosine/S-adenosylhomocysteine nucleosidase n=1 Tax=Phenylobacterium sp. TaxID=1871053 RepID=UPI001B41B41D|nr:5'-methylthioadenosine/S-adenosylhomocysteine nucleosidase [Phenylobacterium sp.]MBP7648942.1 5'-methylthioadenosine/S-adenosylhomocysteine nucleosidase [Phenylobacterium sp.]MBP7816055.1 5'-methylthioadenosine/S-adenosylhomocysteine nucleosidase [Phenylobacterium sp.]MBP9232783.1 5'-methylthioadenosine/S-adenosylhomocysteine nucleosidase [Phenylobacterium sp.]MBP9756468.1 5'-methylthioadenosine/S-adenosylhomocysteine nucleosidase [Phenylobacterium sp.]